MKAHGATAARSCQVRAVSSRPPARLASIIASTKGSPFAAIGVTRGTVAASARRAARRDNRDGDPRCGDARSGPTCRWIEARARDDAGAGADRGGDRASRRGSSSALSREGGGVCGAAAIVPAAICGWRDSSTARKGCGSRRPRAGNRSSRRGDVGVGRTVAHVRRPHGCKRSAHRAGTAPTPMRDIVWSVFRSSEFVPPRRARPRPETPEPAPSPPRSRAYPLSPAESLIEVDRRILGAWRPARRIGRGAAKRIHPPASAFVSMLCLGRRDHIPERRAEWPSI